MKTTIGFLSGSGPEAGLYMGHCLHKYLQRKYNAVQDKDYLDYVLYNRPLQGFDETGISDFEKVIIDFKKAMQEINNMGVSYIGIACNTLHLLISYLPSEIQEKTINMVDETVKLAIDKGIKKLLILGSHTTNIQNLYGGYCEKYFLDYIRVSDNEQRVLDSIIEKVMGANNTYEDSVYINYLVQSYIYTEKIDGFVLGCTELPLAYKENTTDILYFNSNEVLVQSLVDKIKKSGYYNP